MLFRPSSSHRTQPGNPIIQTDDKKDWPNHRVCDRTPTAVCIKHWARPSDDPSGVESLAEAGEDPRLGPFAGGNPFSHGLGGRRPPDPSSNWGFSGSRAPWSRAHGATALPARCWRMRWTFAKCNTGWAMRTGTSSTAAPGYGRTRWVSPAASPNYGGWMSAATTHRLGRWTVFTIRMHGLIVRVDYLRWRASSEMRAPGCFVITTHAKKL